MVAQDNYRSIIDVLVSTDVNLERGKSILMDIVATPPAAIYYCYDLKQVSRRFRSAEFLENRLALKITYSNSNPKLNFLLVGLCSLVFETKPLRKIFQ